MTINRIELQKDFTIIAMVFIYQLEGSDCDDEDEMMERYLHDSIFRERVKEWVECSIDITLKHARKAP